MWRTGAILVAIFALLAAGTARTQARSVSLTDAQNGSEPPADRWDASVAERLVGKTVLIGLTHPSHGDTSAVYEQLHGVVAEADRKRGFRVELQGARSGEEYWLPPQTTNFVAAEPGTYPLRSTGEEVENPDFISNWTINPPAH